MQQPLLQNLRWMRIIGDTIFLSGVGSFAWFVLGLKTGWSLRRDLEPDHPPAELPAFEPELEPEPAAAT